MSEHLEQILHDIYDLDPTLKERDGEVRALIAKLEAVKPDIAVRPDFVASLRAELLALPTTPTTPIPGLPWYMVYGAPLGVAALLLLMLLPQQTSNIPPTTRVPVEPAPAANEVDTDPELETPRMMQRATEMQSPEADSFMALPVEPQGESDPAFSALVVPDEGVTSMMAETAFPTPTLPVLALMSYNRFEPVEVAVYSMQGAAGFVVVEKIERNDLVPGKVVAVSPYLQASFALPLRLALREDLQSGARYRVALYHDNLASPTDRAVFNPNTDTQVYELRFMVVTDGSFLVLP